MSLNKVMLIGNLGDDIKMHHFDNGNCIGNFPLATNESYKDKDGNKVDKTEWHNIVVRNKTAEIMEKYLKKGDQVYVEGKIATEKWQDDKGADRYTTKIHVFNFTFLSNKGGE
ncbi:MAG: single-stranded DNA-binding protein [Gelidibacter sp.]|nr:single-stranded DNA-binding protein [Gelidibacter sp.]